MSVKPSMEIKHTSDQGVRRGLFHWELYRRKYKNFENLYRPLFTDLQFDYDKIMQSPYQLGCQNMHETWWNSQHVLN